MRPRNDLILPIEWGRWLVVIVLSACATVHRAAETPARARLHVVGVEGLGLFEKEQGEAAALLRAEAPIALEGEVHARVDCWRMCQLEFHSSDAQPWVAELDARLPWRDALRAAAPKVRPGRSVLDERFRCGMELPAYISFPWSPTELRDGARVWLADARAFAVDGREARPLPVEVVRHTLHASTERDVRVLLEVSADGGLARCEESGAAQSCVCGALGTSTFPSWMRTRRWFLAVGTGH